MIVKNLSKFFFSSEVLKVPTIDLSSLSSEVSQDEVYNKLGQKINEANTTIGFFLIKNTGVDFKFVKSMVNVAEKFFISPESNRMSCRKTEPEFKAWGYWPRNTEQLQRGKDFKNPKNSYLNDVNEQYNLQSGHKKAGLPERVFPKEPKEFESYSTKYFNEMEKLSNILLRGFAAGLNLQTNFFENKFDYNSSVLRMLYYPGNIQLNSGQYRASEHTDYGALTILYSTAPGLQVKNRQGRWLDIDIPEEHFVVNIGDLMAFWTNDHWVSNLHRVVGKDNNQKRISLAFFHNPNHDALIEGIYGEKNKYEPVKSGDFIMKKFRASVGEN